MRRFDKEGLSAMSWLSCTAWTGEKEGNVNDFAKVERVHGYSPSQEGGTSEEAQPSPYSSRGGMR